MGKVKKITPVKSKVKIVEKEEPELEDVVEEGFSLDDIDSGFDAMQMRSGGEIATAPDDVNAERDEFEDIPSQAVAERREMSEEGVVGGVYSAVNSEDRLYDAVGGDAAGRAYQMSTEDRETATLSESGRGGGGGSRADVMQATDADELRGRQRKLKEGETHEYEMKKMQAANREKRRLASGKEEEV